jgi:hypothetical protein
LAATLDNNTRLSIDQDKTLYIDGIALTLNPEQQHWSCPATKTAERKTSLPLYCISMLNK